MRTNYWCGIPVSVYECFIGGYQVIKKWLSYRDASVIDRPLTRNEVREGNVDGASSDSFNLTW